MKYLPMLRSALLLILLVACGESDEASPTQVISAEQSATPHSEDESATGSPTNTRTRPPTNTPSPAPTIPPPADAAASALVEGNLNFQLPAGDPGIVSVLAVGPVESSGSVPVILRNNTSDSITEVHVTGTARGPDGALLGSGQDQSLEPTIVAPGEIVFGYIYFGFDTSFPDGTTYEISATYDKGDSNDYFFGLEIAEINHLGDRIVGILRNPHSDTVTGPISVDAICFDDAGQLISTQRTFADQDSIPAGGTGPFQIDLYFDPCPMFLVAASGFGF